MSNTNPIYGDEWKYMSGNQHVFDHVVGHLIRQGGRTTRNVLRDTSRGRANVLGCVLPDRFYRPDMEVFASNLLLFREMIRVSWYEEDIQEDVRAFKMFLMRFSGVLHALQGVYWRSGSVEKLITNLSQVAERSGVDFSPEQREALRANWHGVI